MFSSRAICKTAKRDGRAETRTNHRYTWIHEFLKKKIRAPKLHTRYRRNYDAVRDHNFWPFEQISRYIVSSLSWPEKRTIKKVFANNAVLALADYLIKRWICLEKQQHLCNITRQRNKILVCERNGWRPSLAQKLSLIRQGQTERQNPAPWRKGGLWSHLLRPLNPPAEVLEAAIVLDGRFYDYRSTTYFEVSEINYYQTIQLRQTSPSCDLQLC